ncbi:MAG: hypothetical protein KGL95_10795, partial [Patescibacteria group bacterium]|nr:hypothetical protein [Patescibacteria group bacterium]
MSGIRITYSGLILFVVGLISVFTSLISNFLITRNLTITDYGTWGLISGLYGYIVVIEPIMSYWATREIARGIESGKTAMFSSGIFSI